MKIALRDDDTCFYTKPEELKKAFEGLNIPISLSVVPFAVFSHAGTYPYGPEPVETVERYADVGENSSLIEYIKKGIEYGHFEVSLHGVHHEYFAGQAKEWIPETEFYDLEWLLTNIGFSREHLESIFGVHIQTFIAPSNAVSNACAMALDELGMDTNSTINKHFTRNVSAPYLRNYIFSNIFRMVHGTRLCLPQQYKGHMELASFDFENEDVILRQYESCQKHNQPLVIYTHYWDLLQSPEKKKQLISFINRAVQDGAEPVFLSRCFETRSHCCKEKRE